MRQATIKFGLPKYLYEKDWALKVRDVIKRLSADGWYLARPKGSHRQFKHHTKPKTVMVSGLGVDVPIGTPMKAR